MPRDLAQPWRGFLADLDALVSHDVRLHCCGGFVMTIGYGLARTTADLDVLSILPNDDQRALAGAAGRDSALHATHGVYLDIVTVATYPDSYESRLGGSFDPHAFTTASITFDNPRERWQGAFGDRGHAV